MAQGVGLCLAIVDNALEISLAVLGLRSLGLDSRQPHHVRVQTVNFPVQFVQLSIFFGELIDESDQF